MISRKQILKLYERSYYNLLVLEKDEDFDSSDEIRYYEERAIVDILTTILKDKKLIKQLNKKVETRIKREYENYDEEYE